MKKIAVLFIAIVMLSSCGMTNHAVIILNVLQGAFIHICEFSCHVIVGDRHPLVFRDGLVDQVRPGGSRQVPPPGICAEYGYILLLPETAETFLNNATTAQKKLFKSDDYGVLFTERGKEMLQKEIELYPESAKFIEPLIKKLAR